MKQPLYTLSLLVALCLAACSQEENLLPEQGEEVTMTFTASLPRQAVTRAEEEQQPAADSLVVGIYEKNGDNYKLVKTDGQTITSNSFNYEAVLLKGTTYRIVFWAYNKETEGATAPYDLADLTKITLNSKATNYDAFTAYTDATGGSTENHTSVTLTRPVAQVNIATSAEDYKAAESLGHTPTQATLTLSSCPKTFNALTGEVSETTKLSFTALITAPSKDATTVPFVTGYTFAKTTAEEIDCKLDVTDGTDTFFTGEYKVKAQANYRTNISGQVMTGKVNYTVSLPTGEEGTNNQEIK